MPTDSPVPTQDRAVPVLWHAPGSGGGRRFLPRDAALHCESRCPCDDVGLAIVPAYVDMTVERRHAWAEAIQLPSSALLHSWLPFVYTHLPSVSYNPLAGTCLPIAEDNANARHDCLCRAAFPLP